VSGGPAGPGVVYRVGVLADTHGELPAAAGAALAGVDAIVHAGDVVGGAILGPLEAIAPVTVVRGNCDTGSAAVWWPDVANVRLGGVRVIVAHRAELLTGDLDPAHAGARVAVCAHTHVGRVEERDGVLWVNPGSTTCPRRGSAASVAIVEVAADGSVSAHVVPL
jgi:putative phosphoesterase